MPSTLEKTSVSLPLDAREQLFNGGEIGPITHIQVSTERITQLNGILFDLDPQNLLGGPLLPALSHEPEQFYEQCVQPWLANDPVLQHMEVRISGTGLHAILWLDPPIEFTDDGERKRWCSITKVRPGGITDRSVCARHYCDGPGAGQHQWQKWPASSPVEDRRKGSTDQRYRTTRADLCSPVQNSIPSSYRRRADVAMPVLRPGNTQGP